MSPCTENKRPQVESCGLGTQDLHKVAVPSGNRNRTEHAAPASERRRETFPCLHPHNRGMSNVTDRKNSFYNWHGQTSATTDQLAEAGLYYLGNGDQTKCFYCNGGLENWEWNDEPYAEHAKWFPECEYLLKKKGVEYVASISHRFPNLDRPRIPRAPTTGATANVVNVGNTTIITSRRGNTLMVTGNYLPVVQQPFEPVGRRRVVRSLDERVMEAMNHELTSHMRAFGFTSELIKEAIRRKLNASTNSRMFGSVGEFLDAVQREEREERERDNIAVANPPRASNQQESAATAASPAQNPASPGTVQRQIEEMRNERRCKICLDEESQCVFEPCGHLCSCLRCGSQLRNCPICRRHISTTLRVYTS